MGGIEHGTSTRYHRYGCRCDPCKAAGAEWRKKYLERVNATPFAGVKVQTCNCGEGAIVQGDECIKCGRPVERVHA